MRKLTILFALVTAAWLALIPDAEAGRRRGHRGHGGCGGGGCGSCCESPTQGNCPCGTNCPCAPGQCESGNCPKGECKGEVAGTDAADALDVVNAMRAARGLPAYQRDDGLATGALACVSYRAKYGIFGHCRGATSDFAFLPAGTQAAAAGADLGPQPEFGTCCMWDRYRYAGAARVKIAGGYMCQIFVR